MNKEVLIKGVESALPLLNTPGGTEKLSILLYHAAEDPAKSDPKIITLISLLREEPELETFNGYLQVIADSASRVEYSTLAGWLLRRAQAVGPQQAISDLELYLASDRLPCNYAFAIAGINLPGSCSLGSDIELVPWGSLPDSKMKRLIYRTFTEESPIHSPTAVLLRPVIVPKLHVRQEDWKVSNFNLPHEELQDTLLCLGLIGPVAPYLLAWWLGLPDWVPIDYLGYSSHYQQGFPRKREWPTGGCELACHLIAAFRALDNPRKVRLRLAMQRLNSAMCRLTQEDAAIDLGIVFEILFLQDISTDRPELTFRLRVRAARYLEADSKERHRVFTLLNDLYRVRSAVVHTGHIPKKIKGGSVQDLLDQGFAIAADALGRLISSGDPDWDQVILS